MMMRSLSLGPLADAVRRWARRRPCTPARARSRRSRSRTSAAPRASPSPSSGRCRCTTTCCTIPDRLVLDSDRREGRLRHAMTASPAARCRHPRSTSSRRTSCASWSRSTGCRTTTSTSARRAWWRVVRRQAVRVAGAPTHRPDAAAVTPAGPGARRPGRSPTPSRRRSSSRADARAAAAAAARLRVQQTDINDALQQLARIGPVDRAGHERHRRRCSMTIHNDTWENIFQALLDADGLSAQVMPRRHHPGRFPGELGKLDSMSELTRRSSG